MPKPKIKHPLLKVHANDVRIPKDVLVFGFYPCVGWIARWKGAWFTDYVTVTKGVWNSPSDMDSVTVLLMEQMKESRSKVFKKNA